MSRTDQAQAIVRGLRAGGVGFVPLHDRRLVVLNHNIVTPFGRQAIANYQEEIWLLVSVEARVLHCGRCEECRLSTPIEPTLPLGEPVLCDRCHSNELSAARLVVMHEDAHGHFSAWSQN